MKRNLILCVIVAGTLLISAVGCQRDSAVLPSDAASDLSSQEDILSTSSSDASVAEATLDSEPASKAPVSSQASSSPAPASTPAEGKESSIPSPSSSEVPVSYTYSDKVAEQMKEVDPANPPQTIWVFLTPAASDLEKTYDSSFFPGIDVTVSSKSHQGGTPTYDVVTSKRLDDIPLEILLSLEINESGWENFQKVVSVLDRRDDISVISFKWIGVYA